MNLWEKLIEIRRSVPYLQKENAGAQYKYVSSCQALEAVRGKMDEYGVLLVPCVSGHELHKHENSKDGKITITYFTEIDMTYQWVNAEKPDEVITVTWYGQGVDIAGEKGVGKAYTYAEKYFMLKMFNIPTDKDDPDANQEQNDNSSNKNKNATASTGKQSSNEKSESKDGVISEAQSKRLYAMSDANAELCRNIASKYGYKSSKDIKVKDYEAICKEIENAKSSVA